MLRRYVEQLLNLYNYIDGIMVTDQNGIVEYYTNFRPEVNSLKERDVLGRHVLEVYPMLTEETSSLMQVIQTQKPISNQFQVLTTYKGQTVKAINTTMPIMHKGKLIGAVDVSRYIDKPYERQNIVLSLKETGKVGKLYTLEDIITNSPAMEQVKVKVRMIADTDSSVLICGETGTGKELVAQSLHTCSSRRSQRFVSQNCAAIPANLLESILFGTVKGSYTGAENRPGLFEIANGGPLFLDEINSMELSVQAKILRAIEEKQVTRIGGFEPIHTNVKIVSAVNEDPMRCIAEKRLREDLFYRLSVVQLDIPPLRERINDLFFMTDHFIGEYNQRMNRDLIGIDEEVEQIFRLYSWPGNVRELKNVIEGAFNVASSRFIRRKDLPGYLLQNAAINQGISDEFRSKENGTADEEIWINLGGRPDFSDPQMTLDALVADYERRLIIKVVAESDSLVEAARKLKISKQSMNYKLVKHKIPH